MSLSSWRAGRRAQPTLEDELRAHLAERIDDLTDAGVPEAEARRQAHREFGNVTRHIENSREVWRFRPLDDLGRTFRHAMRSGRAHASTFVTCLAVLGLSTGLFATALVMADALVFRPLHLKDGNRVLSLGGLSEPGLGWDVVAWWSQVTTLERLVRWDAGVSTLDHDRESLNVQATLVSPGFFTVLQGDAAIGRVLGDNDYGRTGDIPVVLSDALWRLHFGGDTGAIGAKLRVGGRVGTVIGVMPAAFAYPAGTEVWTVRAAELIQPTLLRPTGSAFIGLMAPGQSMAGVRSNLLALLGELNATHTPKTGVRYGDVVGVRTLAESLARDVRIPTLALLWATGIVLLLAIASASTLLLGHVLERRQEFAVRTALGASRGRVLGQLALEMLILGGIAGAVGGIAGAVLFHIATPVIAPLSPFLAAPAVSMMIVVIGWAIGAAAGVVAGFSPVLITAVWTDWTLLQQRASDRGARRGGRMRNVLVVVQVTAAMVLIVATGVALRTFLLASQTPLGFEASNAFAVRYARWPSSHTEPGILAQQLVDDRVVSASAVTSTIPVVDSTGYLYVGSPTPSMARALRVGPGFFDALGIHLLQGRDFRFGDANVTIVSRRLASQRWGDASPVGQMLLINRTPREVIGVADDIREDIEHGLPDAQVYLPLELPMGPSKITQLVSMVLRCPDAHGCSGIEASVAQSVERAGGRLLWADTMEHVLGSKLAGAELRTLVSGTYGLLGLILAVAAIYGTVRYTAMTRIRELTIRMALGASRTNVQRLLVRHGLIVAGVGVVIGAGIALPLLSVVRSLVYGLAFVDPLAYAAAGAALLVGALAASIGPARRLSNTSLRRVLND